jgi:tetratricopeptide (TPR) repeat protein
MRALGVILTLVALCRVSFAESALELARHDVETSDYLAARGALVSALDAGTASPEDLAEIYKLSGIVEGALGKDAEATAAFARWLAIDPKGTLPPGTSPKITRPFDAAAKKADALKVKVDTEAAPPSVTLVIQSDPQHLVTRARVFVRADGGAETKVEASGAERIKLALPAGKRLDLRVQALDEHGNRVVELGSAEVPIVITGAAPDVVVAKKPVAIHHEESHAQRPLYLRWWLWGAVGVAFAGAGTYFGIEARTDANALTALNAASQQHVFTEAQDLESRARREALFCNIGLGAAGAFAIGATILYLTEPRMETRVSAVPTRGGATVVYGGTF